MKSQFLESKEEDHYNSLTDDDLIKLAKGGTFSKGDPKAQLKYAKRHYTSSNTHEGYAGKAAEQDFIPALLFLVETMWDPHALTALERGRNKIASQYFARLQQFAKKGNEDAKYAIAQCEKNNKATTGNVAAGEAKLFELWLQGHPEASKENRHIDIPLKNAYQKAIQGDLTAAVECIYIYLGIDGRIGFDKRYINKRGCSGEGIASQLREWLQLAATKKDIKAQFGLAFCNEFSLLGIKENIATALALYKEAADKGHAYGQIRMGDACYEGKDKIIKNYAEAVKWYEMAAAQNLGDNSYYTNFYYHLGSLYEIGGHGLVQNPVNALKYFQCSAEIHGETVARLKVGECYLAGKGCEKSSTKAYWQFKEIVDKYHRGIANRGYNSTEEAANNYLEQLIKYDAAVNRIELTRTAAIENNYEDQNKLGVSYLEAKEVDTAMTWFEKANNKSAYSSTQAHALYNLGICYELKQDYKKAMESYRKSISTLLITYNKEHCSTLGKGRSPKEALTDLYKTFYFPNLRSDSSATTLDLQNTSFKDSDLFTVTDLLIACKSITQINFTKTAITAPCVQALTEALKNKRSTNLTIFYGDGQTSLVYAADPNTISAGTGSNKGTSGTTANKQGPSGIELQYDKLVLGEKIGQGGFGIVNKATYRNMNVAVKTLMVTGNDSSESEKDFINEATVMEGLRSEFLVRFFGYCLSPKRCLVMEYMEKGSLYTLLKTTSDLGWDVRYKIALDITCGLDHLHQDNILHRDIKSLNVLLDKNFRAKLTDFGLSVIRNNHNTLSSSEEKAVGTVRWMAPELFKKTAKYTKKSDIYSLGITFFEIATNKVPFASEDNSLISVWVAGGDRDDIPEGCPQKMRSLIEHCWTAEPYKRPDADKIVAYLKSNIEDFTLFETGKNQDNQASVATGYQDNFQTLKKF